MAEDTITRPDTTHRESTGTAQEIFLALLWLGTTMYAAHATLGTVSDSGGVLGAAAAAMPDLILASLLTGVSLGAAAGSRFGRGGRLLAGLAAAAGFGLVAVFAMRLVYGAEPPVTTLAVTVGLAAVVGGAFTILPAEVVDGGVWAMTWVAFLAVMFPVWLLSLGDDNPLADTRLQAAISGLVGLIALQKLRGERRPWHWYLLAGALPGLYLAAAELLTRLGGSVLTDVIQGADADSPLNPSADQLRDALIVLAVGATVCLVAGIAALVRSRDEHAESSRR